MVPANSNPVGKVDQANADAERQYPMEKRPHWRDRTLAVFTVLIFLTYLTSDYFLWRQLKITSGQLEQMKAADRPWIGIDRVDAGDCYDPGLPAVNPKRGPVITICIQVKNYGKTPAYIGVNTRFEKVSEPWLNAEDLCESAKQPVEAYRYSAISQSPWMYTSDVKPASGESVQRVVEQGILGCIAYRAVTDNTWHQTPFHVMVRRKDKRVIVFDGGEVPKEQFEITPVFIVGRAN